MKKIAFLFPGQGAQYPGMGKDFATHFSVARETFEEADDILGESLSNVIFEGPEQELMKTKNSQTGIFVTSVAILRVLQQQLPAIQPSVCAGLSLGEYTALFASGHSRFKHALQLVQKRAQLMNEACETVPGIMAAVLGMSASELDTAIFNLKDVWVANYNCPGQIVISGTKDGIAVATEVLKAQGAKRVIPLQVHGAFHSGLMQKAQDQLTPFIDRTEFFPSDIGFVMNVTGNFSTSLEEIRRNLTLQVTHSVRWEQGILAMEKSKIDSYIEIGCGRTLTAFNKKIGLIAPTLSLEKLEHLEVLATELLCSS